MDKWTEFKTAYRLAKLGTLTATADDLGIHRTTVMRHIDALEETLGAKLFQRNDKGYIPTEVGLEVMRLGEITDIQLTQFASKTKIKEDVLEGAIKVTCTNEMSVFLFSAIAEYRALYPKVTFEIMADTKKFELEYGDADLAIRVGTRPETLDNVVIPFHQLELVFCAHRSYVEKHGLPTKKNVQEHMFVAVSERIQHLPWNEWIHNNALKENLVLTSNTQQVLSFAMHIGAGISITCKQVVENNSDLIEVDMGEKWALDCWILVHRDIINIPKVRKFVDFLKETEVDPNALRLL